VAALAAFVAGVACSDPKAAPLPPPTPTTVAPTTASPTPSAVDYEAEVRRAVDAYFAALNAALRDPAHRTDALAALIDPSCSCRQVLDLLHGLAEDGYYIDYRYAVSDVRVQQAGALGASLTYVVSKTAGAKRTSSGRVVTTFEASRGRFSVHLRREGDAWLLDRLDEMT